MKKLIIFDLDGTLLNTLGDLAESANYALKEFGYETHPCEEYCFFVGNGITKLIERALPENAKSRDIIEQVKAEFVSHYSAHSTNLTQPYPGICDLLDQLHHQGFVLAVASNKYHEATEELIRYYFERGTFAVVRGQRDDRPSKPDPAIINEIMGLAGVGKEETLYVGDSEVDMQTARNSGVDVVGVTWGFRPRKELEENGATYIAEVPAQILDYVTSRA